MVTGDAFTCNKIFIRILDMTTDAKYDQFMLYDEQKIIKDEREKYSIHKIT